MPTDLVANLSKISNIPDFLNSTHDLADFVPFGDSLGKFDAKCHPSGGYINVTVKVKWDFNFGWSIWNQTKQSTFKKQFKEMVSSYWSERLAIHLEGNSDHRKVRILPNFAMVDADAGAHFTLNIQRFSAGRSMVEEGGACRIYAGAVKQKPDSFFMKYGYNKEFGVNGHDKLIFSQAKRDFDYFVNSRQDYKAFDVNSDKPEPAYVTKFVSDYKAIVGKQLPAIPITILGCYVAGELPNLGKQRADNLVKAIQATGFRSGYLEAKQGGVTEPGKLGTAKYVKVQLETNTELVEAKFLAETNNFPIGAHEFGHMIGLSDEYDSASKDDSVTACINCAQVHHIEKPAFSSQNSSLMSEGDEFLAFHYTTVVDAIEKMAENFRAMHPNCSNGSPTITVSPAKLNNIKELYKNNTWLRDFARTFKM